MFKKYIQNKIRDKIHNDLDFLAFYTSSGIKYIDGDKVKHTLTLRNRKCHQNSYDIYKQDKKFKIKMCWCINKENDTDDYFVHFLNYNTETKEYFDNTLGGESAHYNYYILHDNWLHSKVDREDANPSSWLGYLKSDFYNRYVTTTIERFFIKKDDM